MSDFRIRYAVKTSLSQSGTHLPACSKAIFASVMLSEIRQMSPELVCIFACFRPPDNVAAVAVTQQFGRYQETSGHRTDIVNRSLMTLSVISLPSIDASRKTLLASIDIPHTRP